MVGVKAVLLSRIQEHLKIKDGRAEEIYPRSSFFIDCTGDVCLGDNVLFRQTVYDTPFDIERRCVSGPPLVQRWVAGKVVNESYGAGKQQHTFTIEVLWSTGTKPFHVMRPLKIKGRNLYRIQTLRQPWPNEAERQKVLDEKHARGAEARALRRAVNSLKSREPRGRNSHSQQNHHEGRYTETLSAPESIAPPGWNFHSQQSRYEDTAQQAHHGPLRIRAQHGRVHTQRQVYQRGMASPNPSAHPYPGRQQAGATTTPCSTAGCENLGAKQCTSRSCASCCRRNGTTTGFRCPRRR